MNITWQIADYHQRPGIRSSRFQVQDGVDGVPSWEATPRIVFIPYVDGHVLGTTEAHPPITPSGVVIDAFAKAFGERFGDPRCVDGEWVHPEPLAPRFCSYVIYARPEPDTREASK